MKLAMIVALLLTSLLGGCVVVPYDGHGDGYHQYRYWGDHEYYRHNDGYYRYEG